MADCVYRKKPPPRLFRLLLLLTAVFRADGNDRCLMSRVAMSIFFWWNTTRRVCCWLIRFSWRTRWQRGRRENRWRPYFTKRVDSYLGLEYQISIDLYVLLCIAVRRETKTSWNIPTDWKTPWKIPFFKYRHPEIHQRVKFPDGSFSSVSRRASHQPYKNSLTFSLEKIYLSALTKGGREKTGGK